MNTEQNLNEATDGGSALNVELDRIRVEVKSDILGDSIFWEGPVSGIQQIRNVPARETAEMVAQDGKSRVCGMWHVYVVPNAKVTGWPVTKIKQSEDL